MFIKKLKRECEEQDRQVTRDMARMHEEFQEMHRRNKKRQAEINTNINKYL
jgi:molecular chaperone GrpE (heat shock protein)